MLDLSKLLAEDQSGMMGAAPGQTRISLAPSSLQPAAPPMLIPRRSEAMQLDLDTDTFSAPHTTPSSSLLGAGSSYGTSPLQPAWQDQHTVSKQFVL